MNRLNLNRDQLLFLGYAVVSAALTLTAAHGWVSKDDADTIGGALLAFAAAYHIPNAKATEALSQVKSPEAAEDHTPSDLAVSPGTDETEESFAVNPRGDTA